MITVVKINDKEIQHKDGLVYVDNLNETLDSGVIVCEGIERLEINPLDAIDITFPDNSQKRMVVSSFNESIASYEPKRYDYQIQYVSPTLLTERITLPNLAITTIYKKENDEEYLIENGSYYSRSVAYYIKQYCEEYLKITHRFDQELMDIAKDVICPEMSFNRPTLKEVLQALLETLDLIFTLKFDYSRGYYIVSFVDPNATNNQIDESKLDSDTISNSVNSYASNLDIELTNAINEKVTKTIPFISLRSKDAIMTTDNAEMILSDNIYSIEKLEINLGLDNFYGLSNGALSNLQWIDITDYVVEQSVYESLEVGNVATDPTPSNLKKFNALYYKQGDNSIKGFGNRDSILGIIEDSRNTLYYIIKDVITKRYPEYEIYLQYVWIDFGENFFKYMYRLEYTTQQDVKMHTERTKKIKHQSTLFDSQDNQYVNAELFAKNSLSTLNRLSNNERTITAVYNNFNDIPRLADYIDDYILVSREISVFDNYCIFKGILTKYYGNKYQFNAINSKKRFYNISNEKITRHELLKRYYAFSYTNNIKANDEYNDYVRLAQSMLNFSDYLPQYMIVGFKSDSIYYPYIEIILQCNNYKAGNSLLTTFGFDDNIIAGVGAGQKDTGGYHQVPTKYVNEYGERNNYDLFAFDSFGKNFTFSSPAKYEDFWGSFSKHLPFITWRGNEDSVENYPYKQLTECIYMIKSQHHKDQREVLKWTIQHSFVSNEENIILGEELYKCYSGENTRASLLTSSIISIGDNKFTSRKNDVIKNYTTLQNIALDAVTLTDNYMTINYSGNIGIAYKGHLIIGINNYIANTPIYLNITDER